MRFFAKLTAICNLSFLVYLVLRMVEFSRAKKGIHDNLIPLPFVQGSLVILGFTAIFVNFFFNLIVLLAVVFKRPLTVPKWILWFNFLLLLAQIIFHSF